ncbi:FUSC family protein [Dyella psychrodurans]|uniref:FUSC family protein n=1 Tax=Dyella psychrodurans TaxID=1927960 RepID=A0A370X164_9GAMM|nr:FUSC family protein [Dyella psychrodurans]RDS82001.1 FUSC family protein [Dyella psychrodurans]
MSAITRAASLPRSLFLFDPQKLLFSLSSFIAAAITLGIAFEASLPRPWWALLTVYVTAQPMAGAFRPKILYRLGGILTGATVSILVVPNLQHAPELLVLCMAGWTGLCIYLAVLDRTPRAFLFQMAAFSSAVISFPYLDDPADVFTTTISRVEEMTVAIVSVSLVHGLLQPWSVTPVIHHRALAFLADAARWTRDALGQRHTRLEYEHRRKLAADIAELGMMAIHLPFDQRPASAGRKRVLDLQKQLATILPLASATANRLDMLSAGAPLEPALAQLIDDTRAWLAKPPQEQQALGHELAIRCRTLAVQRSAPPSWRDLLIASLCMRMAEFVEAHVEGCRLVQQMGSTPAQRDAKRARKTREKSFPLARDHGLAMLAGLATATAIILYCAVWILLAWPNGSATAAFAALITCSFATQDDPAPVLGRYLGATLLTFPLAAFYLFAVLPRVDGYMMLVVTLAPALLSIGYIQASPSLSARALPMFSCLIVALGFLDRFLADFATFINVGLAQVGGIIATLAVAKLFRSVNVRWTVRRMVRNNWIEIGQMAAPARPFRAAQWTGKAIDRLGQIAARMAVAEGDDVLHAADGLADLRIGRNVIAIRRALSTVPAPTQAALRDVLDGISALFQLRGRKGVLLPAPVSLQAGIDRAMAAMCTDKRLDPTHPALLALVGMRCNLFPAAPSPRMTRDV